MNEWVYNGTYLTDISDFPEGAVGFVYRIKNITKDKIYFGKKILSLKRTLKPLKDKKRKRVVRKESDWRRYVGSNKQLQEDVKNGDIIEKYIERICFSKKEMSYYELELMVNHSVLVSEKYYNDNILGKFFRKDLI